MKYNNDITQESHNNMVEVIEEYKETNNTSILNELDIPTMSHASLDTLIRMSNDYLNRKVLGCIRNKTIKDLITKMNK